MADPTAAAPLIPALDNTMGAFYIGVIVSSALYGVTCLQTWFYYNEYPADPLFMKVLVGAVWALDTTHQALISHAVYIYLVRNYFNPAILTTVVWSVIAEVMINGAMALLVQGFFVYRIFKLSSKNWFLTLPVAAMSVAEFGVICTYVGKAAHIVQFEESLKLKALSLTVNALTAATDVAIAFILCVLLQKSRTGFRRSDTMITRLIIFTVNTGLLTSIDAICSLVTYAASPNTFIYICFFFALGRLYSNSLLATLNARRSLSGSSRADESTSISLQGIGSPISQRMATSVNTMNMSKQHGNANLSIKIDTHKEFAHDHDLAEYSAVTGTSDQKTPVREFAAL
ncbi:hypothetical protein OF83DRAFT_1172972 [Amylostereum chailletii]|nr:hypothetical protein OF83DRAFT_1172972 [Amylostereum chailletii]